AFWRAVRRRANAQGGRIAGLCRRPPFLALPGSLQVVLPLLYSEGLPGSETSSARHKIARRPDELRPVRPRIGTWTRTGRGRRPGLGALPRHFARFGPSTAVVIAPVPALSSRPRVPPADRS